MLRFSDTLRKLKSVADSFAKSIPAKDSCLPSINSREASHLIFPLPESLIPPLLTLGLRLDLAQRFHELYAEAAVELQKQLTEKYRYAYNGHLRIGVPQSLDRFEATLQMAFKARYYDGSKSLRNHILDFVSSRLSQLRRGNVFLKRSEKEIRPLFNQVSSLHMTYTPY